MVKVHKYKVFPFLRWWPLVNKQTLKVDLLAGFTGAIIVLPQGIAFAMIAGLPPIYGLYTAIVTPIVAALFGSSYHLVSGPTTTSSIAIFATISLLAVPQSQDFISLALTLTIMVGLIQFSLGVSRLGSVVNFISHSVVTGYTVGAALLIATSQIKHVIGLSIPNEATFIKTWELVFSQFREFNLNTLSLGIGTILIAIMSKKLFPKLPNLLLAMLFGTAVSYFIGNELFPVPLVGKMPRGLPAFHFPNLDYNVLRELAPGAFAVAMLGAIEVISISRSIANKSKQRLDSNQEFIGLGLSNMVGGFFSCFAGSGSFTRSGLNYTSGAKTPMAAIIAALFLLMIVSLVAPWAAYLPIPTIGGIILLVAYSLIDFKGIRQIFRAGKSEKVVFAMTALSILFINLQFSILIGVLFSLIFYLMRTSKPKVVMLAPKIIDGKRKFMNAELHQLVQCPQLHIIRIDGSLFFGAVDHIKKVLYELSETKKHILIVGTGINFIDVTGAELLVAEAERMQSLGGGLYFSQMKKSVREYMDKGYTDKIGQAQFFFHKEEAITAIYDKLDISICKSCEVRIFKECVV